MRRASKRVGACATERVPVSTRIADNFKLDVNKINNTLNITVAKKKLTFVLFGFIIDQSKLYVTVPKRLYENLSVETSSGSIESDGLTANTITFNASSGSVKVKNLETHGKCSIRTSSGSIRASFLKSDSSIVLQASSGSVKVEDIESKAFSVRATSGSLNVRDITTELAALQTTSGSILAYDIIGNLTADASSGSIKLTNKDLIGEWGLRTSSGSVSVKLLVPNSIFVKFKGSSGSGRVDIEKVEYQMKSDHAFIGQIGSGENKLNVHTSSGSFRLS